MNAPALYTHIRKALENNRIEEPQFEAMCIAEHIFGKRLDRILTERPEASPEQVNFADGLIYRRAEGEPLQYLLGKWEFYGMPFYVGKGVLIPRQDTETLVEAVIRRGMMYGNPRIIDLCSGSGCIACAVASKLKNAKVYALENSGPALGYLNRNIELNGVNVEVIEADVLSEGSVSGRYDIIACNPPYLTAGDMKSLQREVRFEPHEALFGGSDGLRFYREITRLWGKSLTAGGVIAFEIGKGQEEDVKGILNENGFEDIEFIKDLAGIVRVVTAKAGPRISAETSATEVNT